MKTEQEKLGSVAKIAFLLITLGVFGGFVYLRRTAEMISPTKEI